MPGEQFGFQERAAVLDHLGQHLGIAHLGQVGQGGQQAVGRRAQVGGGAVATRQVLDRGKDSIQRALATLLGGELLRDRQLILEAAQRHKIQGLRILHHGAEQAADAQWLRAFHRQRRTGQRVIEHGDQ